MEITVPVLVVLCGVIGYSIGKPKNRGTDGLILGIILGPIGWLIAILQRPLGEKCPYCGGLLNKGATCCCHCGREVIKRRIPKVICPMCGAAIASSTLHKGENVCPYCAEPFVVE